MPETVLVRVPKDTHAALHELAQDMHVPMQEILRQAVEQYRRKRLLEQANVAYAALRADPQAWQEELAERALWDTALLDGLDDDEYK